VNWEALEYKEDQWIGIDGWKQELKKAALDYHSFTQRLQDYADIARWAQREVEKAVLYVVQHRQRLNHYPKLGYSGGVALNIKANSQILQEGLAKALYIEPAAADNGLALGCAYYGWLELLKGHKIAHSGNTCFGKDYSDDHINRALSRHDKKLHFEKLPAARLDQSVAQSISAGKTVGWFQNRSEFGPRALGKRSILANPRLAEMQEHINTNIKFREDFRPFAPAVLKEDRQTYFKNSFSSAYMLLADQLKEEWEGTFKAVTHVDGSSRVQIVDNDWNDRFYSLLKEVKQQTGHGMLLNTSFNKKGQPIVETPEEAIALYLETALDVLVLNDWLVTKC